MDKLRSLHFNIKVIKEEYKKRIVSVADDILDEYINEIQFQMKTQEGKEDVEPLTQDEETLLRRKVLGGAYAIIDSFGTGSKMDLTNPALGDYQNSESYNPLRAKNQGAITGWGKENGSKKNIFGEPIVSTGRNIGKNLEKVYVDGKQLFEPISPSYAFQQAFTWIIHANRLPKLIKETTDLFISEIRNKPQQFMSYY